MPESLTYVGEYAFSDCTGLTGNLDLPEYIVTIEKSGFSETGLTGILRLPESLCEIGEYALGETFYYILEDDTKVKDIKLEEILPTLNTNDYSIRIEKNYKTLKDDDIVGSNSRIYIYDELNEWDICYIKAVVNGDVNGDGKIKIYDAFQILKDVLVPGKTLSEIDIQIRDFNGDGQVRIYDAFQFLKQAIM